MSVQPSSGGLLRVQGTGGQMEFDAGTGVLDVQGGVSANTFQYSSPREQVITFPAQVFMPTQGNTNYSKGFVLTADDPGLASFVAHVQLPQGATITSVLVRVRDNSSVRDFNDIGLSRVRLSDQVANLILAGSTTGTPGLVTLDLPLWFSATPDMLVIDNEQYGYVLGADLGGDTDPNDRWIMWAQVWYTVDEPQ